MRKSMIFFMVFIFTLSAGRLLVAEQKYPATMVKKKMHMVITHPTQNHIYFLPDKVKIKVKLVRPADVLFHVWDLSRGGKHAKTLKEEDLRKARDGSYRGAVTYDLKAGKYHVIAAPQTNIQKDSGPHGPIKFSVRLKLTPAPAQKKD